MPSRILPAGVKASDVALNTAILLGVLLFSSDASSARTNVSWSLGLFLYPLFLLVGVLAAWIHYRKHDATIIAPFYVRAWWALIAGAIALPVVAIFRSATAPLAFLVFLFGLGPVIGFQLYWRFANHGRA